MLLCFGIRFMTRCMIHNLLLHWHINTAYKYTHTYTCTVLQGKRATFYFCLIFDKRHLYLLGNTKNGINIDKLTCSFQIRPFLSIQYTLYRAADITQFWWCHATARALAHARALHICSQLAWHDHDAAHWRNYSNAFRYFWSGDIIRSCIRH